MSERVCRLLVAGPPLSGRSTCITWLAHRFNGQVVRIATSDTYVLQAALPVSSLAELRGWSQVRLESAPGPIHSPALYRELSESADGVLFVVDSQQQALESNVAWLQLWFNGTRRSPSEVPLVFVYNKRDLPRALPLADLQQHLNHFGAPYVEAVAVNGTGLLQGFERLGGLLGSAAA